MSATSLQRNIHHENWAGKYLYSGSFKKKTAMKYYHSTELSGVSFEKAIDIVKEALKKEGFGVLTEIDMKATLKKKLDEDFHPYVILGACNPPFAHKALLIEDKIGTMLPCNVIVEQPGDDVEVSAVDPIVSMQGVENKALSGIATEIREKLKAAIDSLEVTA